MSSPALRRRFVAFSALATLITLSACGNRGELFLESSLEGDVEAELRRLEAGFPDDGLPDDAFPDDTNLPEALEAPLREALPKRKSPSDTVPLDDAPGDDDLTQEESATESVPAPQDIPRSEEGT